MINRRRAPSSMISSEKKLGGHKKEEIFANIIGAEVVKGTHKTDIIDKKGKKYSVKSGKKWQIFLYSYNRISKSSFLKILLPCLDSFPKDSSRYFKDREECISLLEKFIKREGREAGKQLPNEEVEKQLSLNSYISAKANLKECTSLICEQLKNKPFLYNFLEEAIFNGNEVDYLVVEDKKDTMFKIFSKEDVLNIFMEQFIPSISSAGKVPEDFNVSGQKTLLRYEKKNGSLKNIGEIEIRNDSPKKYRLVRFNMYSKDALHILIDSLPKMTYTDDILLFGQAKNINF